MDNTKDNQNSLTLRDNTAFGFLVLKTERLTSALYLVTSLLSDNEPLKWKLREAGLAILSDIKKVETEHMVDYGQDFVFYKNIDVDTLVKSINNLTALISIAVSAGTVSTMNLTLLKNEYQKLADNINASVSESMRLFMLSGYDRQSINPNLTSQNKLTDRSYLGSNLTHKNLDQGHSFSKDTKLENVKDKAVIKTQINKPDSDQGLKNDRHDKIISFLKDKGWLSIKDIAMVVPECSMKTVQRDLSLMVDKGLLRKKGDRRWSRYTLVS